MNSVWPKFAIIVACTLSGARTYYNADREWWEIGWGIEIVAGDPPASEAQARDGACTIPCADLGENLLPRHLVGPFGIALSAWALAAAPTLVLTRANQIQGVRACLWPLVQLGLHLFISQILFRHNRVWAFAWAMHAPTAVLARWGPPKRSLAFQAAQRWVALLGVAAVCLYAWNIGGPAGLLRWRTGAHSPCGWSAQLVAVTGVDVLMGIMDPVGSIVMGGA